MARSKKSGLSRQEQDHYMGMVYNSFLRAGMSSNQARIITAEVGRENSFTPQNLFGTHIDPYKDKGAIKNLGIISWNGDRRANLEKWLSQRGLMQGGRITPSQEALDEQAKFIVWEMQNNPSYAKTKRVFLDNPNVSYADGVKVLGTNYIRWRYNDPAYARGHTTRDEFYRRTAGLVNAPAGAPLAASAPSPLPTSTEPSMSDNTAHVSLAGVGADIEPYTPRATHTPYLGEAPQRATTPAVGETTLAAKGNPSINVLSSDFGLITPTTATENDLFGEVAGMGLNRSLEGIYAEAARNIAEAYDKINTNKQERSRKNALIGYLGDIFDSINVNI